MVVDRISVAEVVVVTTEVVFKTILVGITIITAAITITITMETILEVDIEDPGVVLETLEEDSEVVIVVEVTIEETLSDVTTVTGPIISRVTAGGLRKTSGGVTPSP